jgi:CrcB protein
MRRYVFIGLGGFLGAISRFIVKGIQFHEYRGSIPLNTFIVNITGSLILAFIFTIASEVWEFDEDIRLGIGTGFLGAFTTFSTFCKELVILIEKGLYFSAISYVTVSTVLGLASAYFGVVLAREGFKKFSNKEDGELLEDAAE